MKGKRLRSLLRATVAVLVVFVIAITSFACGCKGTIKLLQLADASSVSKYGASGLDGDISFGYSPVSESAYTVYVSPKGDNGNDGTALDKAVCSIKQAQILIRNYISNGGREDCVIILDDGEYFVSGSVDFAYADVANGNKLYVRAKNAGKATISGSKRVEASTITEVNDETLGRVWEIPCATKVNQLYINSDYAIRARYPDSGEQLRLLNWDDAEKNIIIDSKDIEGIPTSAFEGSTLVAEIMWAESYLRVDSVIKGESISRVALVSEDVGVFSRTSPQVKERQSYHFENAREFLSVAGEFWYSESEHKILYLPHESETLENTTVRIPYTEELLTVKGSMSYPISGVYIEGINFMYSGNAHIDGKIGNQANKDDGVNKRFSGTTNDGRPYSAISLEYVTNVSFIGNKFACLGGGAIDLVEGVQNATITKNLFRSVGGNGVFAGAIHYEVGQVKTNEASYIKDVTVDNNYFTDIAWQEYGGCAVILNYSLNGKISHNTINNTKYSAISVGWGWFTDPYPFLANNEISYNYISCPINLMSDGSAIYLVSCQPNSKVFSNYIENVYDSVWKFPNDLMEFGHAKWAISAIYLDQDVGGTSADSDDKVQVYNNYIYEGNAQHYFTQNAKTGCFVITEIENNQKETVKNNAGVDKTVFENIISKAKIYGCYTESAEQATVFGESLNSEKCVFVLKNKEGKFVQLNAKDVVYWSSDKITFKTSNYSSGEAFVLNSDGTTSNRYFLTLNVDIQYSMYDRFNNEWGGLSGLARLLTQRLELRADGFSASSTWTGWPASDIDDNNTYTGWSSADGDPNPYVAFQLDGMSTVSKIVIYARSGVDQPECRKGFNIYGYDKDNNEILLFSSPKDGPEAFPAEGMLTVRIPEDYADTLFKSFKISRPEGDNTYFFIAEVAVIK